MQILAEKEAEKLLEKEGFPVSPREYTNNLDILKKIASRISYPVALKVQGPKILHKSDVGGVIIDIRNEQELEKAFTKIKKIKGYKEVVIQKYQTGNLLLIGLKKDPVFGHTVLVGSGGIYTEILKDISLRICPITEKDAEQMIRELKIYQVLKGVRGEKPANFSKIKEVLLKISNLTKKYPKIKELDINPLIITDSNVSVIDARIVFE
ncbi:MAG: acetate--CoA ligase family protein [Candidatus Woesearchaeota archaeon]|nr:MAG: acetate--CoA ligase family protein [Candidatus Woesearchaeota archaeon]